MRAVDNLSTGYYWRVEEVVGDIDWREADIADPSTVDDLVGGIDIVLHQAALASVARSVDDPLASNHANVTGTLNLLQACRSAGVKRLIYAASSSAYGNTAELPKVESMCPDPRSPYAVSKFAGEQYCRAFGHLGYVETVCLRYFNIFGPMQDPTSIYSAVVPRFISALLEDRPIPLNGDGTQSRDFTYIDNAVSANLLAMVAESVSGEVFNVGCGARYSLIELIEHLESILGKKARVERRPPRPGDVTDSLADIRRAQERLGYRPMVHFKEGLRMTADWFRSRPAALAHS